MTNYQYYEKEITSIFKSGYGVGIHNGKPIGCGTNKCDECDWYPRCYEALGEWLEKEHIATEDEIRAEERQKFAECFKKTFIDRCDLKAWQINDLEKMISEIISECEEGEQKNEF